MENQLGLNMPPPPPTDEELHEKFDEAYSMDYDLEDAAGYEDLRELEEWGWFRYEGIPEENELFPYSAENPMPEEEALNYNLEFQIESIRLSYELRIWEE